MRRPNGLKLDFRLPKDLDRGIDPRESPASAFPRKHRQVDAASRADHQGWVSQRHRASNHDLEFDFEAVGTVPDMAGFPGSNRAEVRMSPPTSS
jgi:hypothetical protein